MSDLVIRRARLGERSVDIRIAAGVILDVVDAAQSARTTPDRATEIDASVSWVVPGIHDHHIHLRALSAAKSSVAAGPPDVTDAGQLRAALANAPAGPHGWVRAVGYHESVAGDLDRDVLDGWVADRPVRVQHRSGALWVLNSLALDIVGAHSEPSAGVERDHAGRATGRLWRMDGWLSARTASPGDSEFLMVLADMSRRAAASGTTGWTDATPGRSDAETELLAGSVSSGAVLQRLHLMVRAGAIGEPPGPDTPGPGRDEPPRVTTGPVKVLLDDFDLPSLDCLASTVRAARRARRPVAIHCVTRTQLVMALAAIDEAGGTVAGDRIEHGAVIPPELIPSLRLGGLTVVTQPNFVCERGDDYLRDVEPEEMPNLWRAASLADAGVAVAAGTDAPFGGEDAWSAMRAATERRTSSGAVLGPDERVDPARAFSWFCGSGPEPGRPRRVAAGEPADLVLLGEPLREAVASGGPPPVLSTIVAGRVVHG